MCHNGKHCVDTPRKKALRLCNDRKRRIKKMLQDPAYVSEYENLRSILEQLEEEHAVLVSSQFNADAAPHETPEQIEEILLKAAKMYEDKDVEGLQALCDERSNSKYFKRMIGIREKIRHEIKAIRKQYDDIRDPREAKKRTIKVTPETIRSLAVKHLELYEELYYVVYRLDQYRVPTAYAVEAISKILDGKEREEGTFREYTDNVLNDLRGVGAFPSGSREWLEARQHGIGGSDVGSILRVDEEYATDNYNEVYASKVYPITDEDVAEQEKQGRSYATAVGRGNAWEEYIRRMFSDRHPELKVTHCKTSWSHSEHPHRHANFDGILCDENGNPDGILEIKTSSNAADWGNTSLGLFGVPKQYQCQVLWYMVNAGFDHGALAVVIDDTEYREYFFTIYDEGVEELVEHILDKTDTFWEKVQENVGKPKVPRIYKDFPAGDLSRSKFEKSIRNASVYRGESFEQTEDVFYDIAETHGFRMGDVDHMRTALRMLYTTFNPSDRKVNLVGIDIEATSLGSAMGRIIETGITIRNPQGEVIETYGSLHDIPHKARLAVGVGAEEIHNISLDDIAGFPLFEDPEVQDRVLKMLKSGIMVAHNLSYEDKFLRVHLRGYAEAMDKGEILTIDTMQLARNLMLDTPDNKLSSFAEGNGIPYVDAHRALNDAEMMMDALFNLQNSLYEEGLRG